MLVFLNTVNTFGIFAFIVYNYLESDYYRTGLYVTITNVDWLWLNKRFILYFNAFELFKST